MPTKNKPYSLFGSYLLFKRLEHDSLGELWRAAKIDQGKLGDTVALRQIVGGDRQAILTTVQTATYIAPVLTGTTIVRNQVIGAIDGIPYVAFDYAGGRSLRHIVDRARGGTMATPQPIPVDQALAITEKVALSLEAIGNLKYQGQRLAHGALIPQFVWINDEGEIRTAGQQLGKGLVASLKQPEIAKTLASYFAPEVRGDGEPTRASDVYSLGAILYLLLTGQEPPDALNPSFFDLAISKATLMATDRSIPDDILPILKRSLALEPASRYPSPVEMRQDLDKLLGTGSYAPTTFNLAFYLHSLLKKEMEGEALDREKEQKVNLAPYVEELASASKTKTAEFLAGVPQDPTATSNEKKKSRMPLIAAAIALAVLGGGAAAAYYLGYLGPKKPASATTATAKPAPKPAANTASLAPVITAVPAGSPELIPATETVATATTTAAMDADARKRALEEEINRRLQAEIMKLQAEYNRQIENEQSRPAPSQSTAAAQTAAITPQREEPQLSAAQLDAARLTETRAMERNNPEPITTTVAPQVSAPQEQPASAPAQREIVEEVREGDLVSFDKLDTPPRLLSQVKPLYPPMALRQRLEANVLLTVLVTETGKVGDVRVLRGDPRKIGFDEAAVRAVRNATFAPATKEGKRVKVWMPIPIKFQL